MITCYIAIGSNLNNPLQQARNAEKALGQLPQSKLLACSSFYHSAPMGPQDQPEYINAVVALATALEPLPLLDQLQAIEQRQGRNREQQNRWGPRTLDLDLLLYGNHTLDLPRLKVPHYGMAERPFVLWPLAEIAPDLHLPDGTALQQLLQKCPQQGLERLLPPDGSQQ